jgi:hypothetical protein
MLAAIGLLSACSGENAAGTRPEGDSVSAGDQDLGDHGAGDPTAGDPLMACSPIEDVRAANGSVEMQVCNVVVTYATDVGFFLQEGVAIGPAIYVHEGEAPTVTAGDVIQMLVTEVGQAHNFEQIVAHGPITQVGHMHPANFNTLYESLNSSTIPPNEDRESELVRITNATVAAIAGSSLMVNYGSVADTPVIVVDTGLFCVGTTFDVRAVVVQWDDTYSVRSWRSSDFSNIDNSACGASGSAPQPGDLVINEILADPPMAGGDANCDGIRDAIQDEFVEIVNVSGSALDLTGATLAVGDEHRHTFSPGTTLPTIGVVVVFGGGNPSCAVASQLAVASTGFLTLPDSGAALALKSPSGDLVVQGTYSAGSEASHTLCPDLSDSNPAPTVVEGYVTHSGCAGATSYASPGTKVDGTSF